MIDEGGFHMMMYQNIVAPEGYYVDREWSSAHGHVG